MRRYPRRFGEPIPHVWYKTDSKPPIFGLEIGKGEVSGSLNDWGKVFEDRISLILNEEIDQIELKGRAMTVERESINQTTYFIIMCNKSKIAIDEDFAVDILQPVREKFERELHLNKYHPRRVALNDNAMWTRDEERQLLARYLVGESFEAISRRLNRGTQACIEKFRRLTESSYRYDGPNISQFGASE